MSSGFERQVIAQVLSDYAAASNIPVSWPNRAVDQPASGPWIRFTLLDATGNQIEMGSVNNTHRVVGTLILQIFVEADSGDGAALQLADAIGELYRQQVLNFPDASGHVRMRDPVVKAIGNSDAYYQVNLSIPFHRDELP
jgi:hypothetical protein